MLTAGGTISAQMSLIEVPTSRVFGDFLATLPLATLDELNATGGYWTSPFGGYRLSSGIYPYGQWKMISPDHPDLSHV